MTKSMVLWAGIVALAAASRAADSLDILLQQRQWFALRDAVDHAEAAPFYRGLVAAAFNDIKAAERDLHAALASGLDNDRQYAAHQALAEVYLRNSVYSKGVLEGKATWQTRPPSDSEKSLMSMMEKLPDMTVASRRPGVLAYSTWDGGEVVAPITVNGQSARFALDSDSNISVLCDSEAKRLGLEEVTGSMPISGISASAAPGARMAFARTLAIGGVELRNVAFAIIRDDQEPFASLSGESRGVIGLPVMIALRTIRWNREKRLEIGFVSPGRSPHGADLAFNGGDPIALVELAGHRLPVVVDTGNEHSVGFAQLGVEFPELLKNSRRDVEEVTGYSGSGSFDAAVLPRLQWKVGSYLVSEPDAPVFLKTAQAPRFYGRLGIDLLNRASEVTVDFQAMQLSLK